MHATLGRPRGTARRAEVTRDNADAVVIGAGHNGLVAAAMLADAGWDVVVLEAQPEPGGAVKSAELFPGFVSDLYSAFYPLSVASPALRALSLEDHGLRWTHAPAVVGHARSAQDDDAPVIYREIDRTAADLGRRDPATETAGGRCSISGCKSKTQFCPRCSRRFRRCVGRCNYYADWAPRMRCGSHTFCCCPLV